MYKRYKYWHNHLSPWAQLAVAFGWYWLFFLSFRLLTDRFIFHQDHTLGYYLFNATFVALVFMLVFKRARAKLKP